MPLRCIRPEGTFPLTGFEGLGEEMSPGRRGTRVTLRNNDKRLHLSTQMYLPCKSPHALFPTPALPLKNVARCAEDKQEEMYKRLAPGLAHLASSPKSSRRSGPLLRLC